MGDDYIFDFQNSSSSSTGRVWSDILSSIDGTEQILNLFKKIIAPVGLFLNFVFLFTVIRVKSMRTIINIYLSNLAVADSLFLLTDFIYALVSPMIEYNILGQTAVLSVRYTFLAASNFFVVTIAAERFSAVRNPLKFKEKASKSRAAKISAGLWVPTVIVGVILVFIPEPFCTYIVFWIHSISHPVCLIVTIVLYIYVVVKVRKQSALLPNRPKRAGKVLRMIVINTAFFFILNSLDTASEIMVTIQVYATNYSWPAHAVAFAVLGKKLHIVVLCAEILRLINSSINSLVYSATAADYREAVVQAFSFLKLCCRCCPRRNPGRPSQPGKQIELRVIPKVESDQEHCAARPSSRKPPSQGHAQHTESQQSPDSCGGQCSRQSYRKATVRHSQQHVQVHVEVHAEPAGTSVLASSHVEHSCSLTDCKPSVQGEQCVPVHPEPAESQQSLASIQEQCPGLTGTEQSAQGQQYAHPEPEGSQSFESCQE